MQALNSCIRHVLDPRLLAGRSAAFKYPSSSSRIASPNLCRRFLETSAQVPSKPLETEPIRLKKAKGKKSKVLLQKNASETGSIVAFATADGYDLEALQRVLYDRGLIQMQHPSDAINLLGEAIYLPRWQNGEAFIFENGTFVTWNVDSSGIRHLMEQVIQGKDVAENAYIKPQEETLSFAFEPAVDRPSRILGDTIILSSQDDVDLPSSVKDGLTPLPPPGKAASLAAASLPSALSTALQMTPAAILDRFAFSSGLVRSCKLAVYEDLLDEHLEGVSAVPQRLQFNPAKLPSKSDIVKSFGYLLNIRQQLNLTESNLLDPPDLLWEAGTGPEDSYELICTALDLSERLDILNKKLDYAENLERTLMELRDANYSHRLEWIIIILITVEVVLALHRDYWSSDSEKKSH